MRCASPSKVGAREFDCMKCKPCRMKRKEVWVSRLMLEAYQHEHSYFVTLTYNQKEVPCDGCVSLRDAQLFLKNLRYRMEMEAPLRKLRYYIVGEYGDVSLRPHYHAVLFGLPAMVHNNPSKLHKSCECMVCRSWGKGGVYIGSVTPASAGYVVAYVLKAKEHVDRIKAAGLAPEFARMSLKPGLGAGAVSSIAEGVTDSDGVIHLRCGDVPHVMRADGRIRPFGRYLIKKLRERLGGDGSEYSREFLRELQKGPEYMKQVRSDSDVRRRNSARIANKRINLKGKI